MEVICILVLGLRDVVVVFDAISPTADCGVDGILVLGLCDVVVVLDAISPTAARGVDGILVLELCDVVVVFDAMMGTSREFTIKGLMQVYHCIQLPNALLVFDSMWFPFLLPFPTHSD